MGPPHLGRAPRAGGVVRARGRTRGLPGARHRTGPASGSRPRCWPRSARPTVFREEVFGPVVAVVPFDDEDDAVRLANDTPYGLSGSIWTENLGGRAGGPRGRERQPVGQLTLVGPLLDAVRRLQALGPGAGAGPRMLDAFTEVKNVFIGTDRRPDVSRLQDRVVVVTGGGSGIGLASARRLAAEGAGGGGRRGRSRGRRGGQEVGGLFVPVDVAVEDQVVALFDAAVEAYGRLDVAFNNGISPPEDDSLLDTDLDVASGAGGQPHLGVPVLQARHPPHARVGKGSIINTALVRGGDGRATQVSYTASKGGVLAMTREPSSSPARTSGSTPCAPGRSTPRCSPSCSPRTLERAARRLVHIPMGRFAEPDEIAGRGGLPGERRRAVRHGLDLPRRRRHLRRLRRRCSPGQPAMGRVRCRGWAGHPGCRR